MSARVLLVVPCYNEAGRLKPERFVKLVESRGDVAVLFVDDGSSDTTPKVLADVLARARENVSVLTLPRNVGKARAVQHGVLAALQQQPEFVGYWDADLSTPLSALQAFIDVLDANPQVDIVMGARVRLLGRRIERDALRHYCGRVFATAASLALHLGVYDTQCGAKVCRANDSVRQAFIAPFRSRWLVDVEILARYMAARGTGAAASGIYELPLETWTEMPGSKLSIWHGVRAMLDLARIWAER